MDGSNRVTRRADEVELIGFLEVFADVDEVADDLRLSGGVGRGLCGPRVRPNENADGGDTDQRDSQLVHGRRCPLRRS